MHIREASALDLFVDSTRLMGDSTLCGVMEFNRQLDPERLGRAAYACILAHPVLHSRLVRGSGPAHWELVDANLAGPVPVEECNNDYHSLVAGPINPYGPMQVCVRLLRCVSGDIIVINISHAAADAYGLQVFMAQLLQEYETPDRISPTKGGIPERDTLWIRSLLREPMTEHQDVDVIDPIWPDPFGRSDAPVSFHRAYISPRDLASIRTQVKKIGGCINDAILAAYLLAMSDITGYCGQISLFFPVNLRRYLTDGSRVMSNQAANVCITLDRIPGEGMAGVLPLVIHETRHLKSGLIGIPEQARLDAACDPEGNNIHRMVERMVALESAGFADIFISNPGVLVLPEVCGLMDAYVCYPGGTMPTTCFVTSTFRGQMTITMGYQDSERAREGTKKALGLFCTYLADLAGHF